MTGSPVGFGELYLLAAFTDTPNGGNPAGVWLGTALPDTDEMLRIAAGVGFSETAFLAPGEAGAWVTRYFSPVDEVSFCGHATIAAGVVLGRVHGPGEYTMETAVGAVPVVVHVSGDGRMNAALTSVEPSQHAVEAGVVDRALAALGWDRGDLDPAIPPVLAYAGARHLVVAVRELATLRRADLEGGFDELSILMDDQGFTTLQLVWREDEHTFHARNPFPPGGIVEDPATGAAAAALGGYLRSIDVVDPPVDLVIRQGSETGRPSLLRVHVPRTGGIEVSGTAVSLTA